MSWGINFKRSALRCTKCGNCLGKDGSSYPPGDNRILGLSNNRSKATNEGLLAATTAGWITGLIWDDVSHAIVVTECPKCHGLSIEEAHRKSGQMIDKYDADKRAAENRSTVEGSSPILAAVQNEAKK